MMACFPNIREPASFDSLMGRPVTVATRRIPMELEA
jgi:hypothetical protein